MDLKNIFSIWKSVREPKNYRDFICIKKLGGVVVAESTANNIAYALSINADMMRLGYVMSQELFDVVKTFTEDESRVFYQSVISALRYIVGADVKYNPMYPNFPKQVMEASSQELYFNAILHYWSCGQWKPAYDELPRSISFELCEYKMINLVSKGDFSDIFEKVLSSNDSISEEDKKIVQWFIDNEDDLRCPDIIPFKENLCFVAALLLERNMDIAELLKTATDVLRVITFLSDGDVSLASNTKFKSLPRKQRKYFISILENVVCEEDIQRHRHKWNKLFHNLHVGEYSQKLYVVAKKVRNNEKIETFNSKVEKALLEGDLSSAISLLEKRPSEYTRRLDHLIRIGRNDEAVVDRFMNLMEDVPTRILLQLLGNLKVRVHDLNKRIVFPKGNSQKAIVVRKQLPGLRKELVCRLQQGIVTTLQQRFGSCESLGNVWIDEALQNCPIPTQQRSASAGLFSVARGTRLDIGSKNTLRFFIYWIGEDIDLSATLHDENYQKVNHISYTNLKSLQFQAFHSGDITSAPQGAAEFIDIDMDQAIKCGVRYIGMNVFVYSGPAFKEHEKCYAGWMTRENPNSNEIFEPETVVQKIDLAANSRNSIPVVFDLIERKAIWADLSTSRFERRGGNNVESNRASIEQTIEAIVESKNKITLYELFHIHAQCRGQLVQTKAEADTIFAMAEGITPYHINEINAEYIV